ncbi:hypothetical protein LCGC14_1538930, partial [marine sediment metagenome]
QRDIPPAELDVGELRDTLLADGVLLDPRPDPIGESE